MKINQFLQFYETKPKGYCPCIIDPQGDILECPHGHLEALFNLDEGHNMLGEIPDNVSPLFYMLQKTGAVAVDYEAQIYSGTLTDSQQAVLKELSRLEFIVYNPMNVHGHISLYLPK